MNIEHGTKVRCVRGNIDQGAHVGEIGVVDGFARLSSYHPREAAVKSEDGRYLGWFWVSDLTPLA